MPCSSINRKATFSRTVSESKSALSWKTIPILPRTSNRSRSCKRVTSSPCTVIRPESGLNKPSASLRIVLLPAPATPNSALVSPTASLNDTPRKTSFSPKLNQTSSNSMEKPEPSWTAVARESIGMVGTDMPLLIRQDAHQELRGKEIDDNDHHRCRDHGLRGRAADALGSSPRRHSVKTTHRRNDEAEKHRLDQAHKNILKHQRLPRVIPILACVECQQKLGNHQPTG